MKKHLKITIIIFIIIFSIATNVMATDKLTVKELDTIIKDNSDINAGNIDAEEIINIYNDLTSQYSHKQIAELIEENKEEIIKSSEINEETINTATQILKNTDEEEIKDIINNDIDIGEIQSKINLGYTPEQILKEVLTPKTVAKISIKLLLANYIIKFILVGIFAKFIILIVIRWIIYKKAGKHGWAVLIPIYRRVVYLEVCKISPWCLLLVLIPVIGWLALAIINIVSRFKLAKAFNRGVLFGLGLLFLKVIFEIILAVSNNEYKEKQV